MSVRMMTVDDRLAVSIGTINIIDSMDETTTGICVFKLENNQHLNNVIFATKESYACCSL